jgi:hypothetical protein
VYHLHHILGTVAYVELEDVHTEPGVFVDSEHDLATALLVGRCRLCGMVYMPIVPVLSHGDLTYQTSHTTQLLPVSNLTPLYDGARHVPGSDQQ